MHRYVASLGSQETTYANISTAEMLHVKDSPVPGWRWLGEVAVHCDCDHESGRKDCRPDLRQAKWYKLLFFFLKSRRNSLRTISECKCVTPTFSPAQAGVSGSPEPSQAPSFSLKQSLLVLSLPPPSSSSNTPPPCSENAG